MQTYPTEDDVQAIWIQAAKGVAGLVQNVICKDIIVKAAIAVANNYRYFRDCGNGDSKGRAAASLYHGQCRCFITEAHVNVIPP